MSKHNNSVKPVSGIVTLPKPEAKEELPEEVIATPEAENTPEPIEATPEAVQPAEVKAEPEVTLDSLLAQLKEAGETNEEAKSMFALFGQAPKNDITFKAVQTYMTGMDAKKKAEEPRKWEQLTQEVHEFVRNKLAEYKLSLSDRYMLITASGVSNQIGTYHKARSGNSGGGNRQAFASTLGAPTYNGETFDTAKSPTALARMLGFGTVSYPTTEAAFVDHGYEVKRADGVFAVTGVKGKEVILQKGPSALKGTKYVIPL